MPTGGLRAAKPCASPSTESDEKNRVQPDEKGVPHEHEPARRLERDDVPIAGREPELRGDEHDGEHAARREAGRAGDRRDEREEPDEELWREHLAEGDERGDRSGEGDDEPLAATLTRRKERPDDPDRDNLERRLDRGERVRERASEVLRAVRVDDGGVVEP